MTIDFDQMRTVAFIAKLPELPITEKQLHDLPEYSSSVPTGITIGKRWKRNPWYFDKASSDLRPEQWVVCEYVPHEDPGLVGFAYYRPRIVEAA